MRKIMLSVAPVSASDTYIDPAVIAEDVFHCYEAGASMVHLHVRDRQGRLTKDMSLLKETVDLIREKCDIVIEISTGGVSDLTIEERVQPCYAPYVEAVSLNVGSVNLGEAVYQNPIRDVRFCVQELIREDKRPEIEVFELGMIHTVKELAETNAFVKPLLFALVFGHGGEMPATRPALRHMKEYLYECFEEEEVLWGYTQAHRTDWEMMRHAIREGASSIRIGFEDSAHLDADHIAVKNAELIGAARQMLLEEDCEPMTPDEVRRMLKIAPYNR